MQTKVSLSNQQLDYIFSLYGQDDFCFNVSNRQFVCKKVFADFLSPNVAKMHMIDPMIDHFNLYTRKPKVFSKVLKLQTQKNVSFKPNDIDSLFEIADQLGNDEILSFISLDNEITTDNVVSILLIKQTQKVNYEKELKFIARNFSLMEHKDLKKLGYETLYSIFISHDFQIKSEDELFDFIFPFLHYSLEEASILLDCIQIEYLSQHNLETFLSFINLDTLNASIWKQICKRLLTFPPKPLKESPRLSKEIVTIPVNHTDKFNGIFKYLNNKCDGNAHLKNAIEVTSSGDKNFQCYKIIDKAWGNRWFTNDSPNSWWMANFKDSQVSISGYSLKTNHASEDNYPHLKSWNIEASNDKVNWTIIDSQPPNNYLKGAGFEKTFTLSVETRPYQYIKLVSTGPDHQNTNYLLLAQIEFFGTIYTPYNEIKDKAKDH
ncbi:hypothetical protein TRFO_10879 [Tritrichomonas foetus]|uniref:BACK domain-containing protein n=1 Tax=Tritrichomonas foetus TaxID=1144522 RepID=A0A1J4J6B0_9EUKA|nr:hypothetical protein TRFO_10879 [Tritrichomonas foetus]|eukprot:OHS94736.1 hypothetical protein TRFO_10879 [Tritrichomonas foetus]